MKKPVKNADYFINEILSVARSIPEMRRIKAEVDRWYPVAAPEEQRKFTESGAAEALEMSCS